MYIRLYVAPFYASGIAAIRPADHVKKICVVRNGRMCNTAVRAWIMCWWLWGKCGAAYSLCHFWGNDSPFVRCFEEDWYERRLGDKNGSSASDPLPWVASLVGHGDRNWSSLRPHTLDYKLVVLGSPRQLQTAFVQSKSGRFSGTAQRPVVNNTSNASRGVVHWASKMARSCQVLSNFVSSHTSHVGFLYESLHWGEIMESPYLTL